MQKPMSCWIAIWGGLSILATSGWAQAQDRVPRPETPAGPHCAKLRVLLQEARAAGDSNRVTALRDADTRLQCGLPATAPVGPGRVAGASPTVAGVTSITGDVSEETSTPVRDYVFPKEPDTLAGRELAPQFEAPQAAAAAPPCIDCGEVVSYRSFWTGKTHQLREFKGKNVSLLLPDSWLGEGGLSVEERRILLDRSDWHYEHFKELMLGEPAGTGLLRIAVLPDTCGWGCGLIASKGIEILDFPLGREIMQRELAADKVFGVIRHEMTHNFDFYWDYLGYLPEHVHAWTDFMDAYSTIYTRSGTKNLPPGALQDQELAIRYLPYYQDPTANWTDCVRYGLCEARGINANAAWGGVTHRFAQLHGPEAVRRMIAFLKAYKQAYEAPGGPGAREDLHVEAMAAGARLNLGCYVDAWRWHASGSGPRTHDGLVRSRQSQLRRFRRRWL